ncbi:uncharacterized protein BDCG_01243 [Blastomyces dermatitidis ER-3]|uniref:Uncharacterized protein n=2 Tax=Blastomyces TaxID=229219 RepID=A0A179UFI1_BLAGS|nr:uncharacterized protein BDBG_02776 [Blastomyces gilchristii SLH14081]XP_045272402.1 uncharacterized protein BDCG_01243 [Blastomyces dermatitidis ER-3]EEQ84438.1 hypothetical protein BDCG_01243 [Blastomyces dermatitidis ER-3]OAT06590.1 hypothetical protein BDBG_02776 [Blastomyces gilchristii SLH14081]
MPELQNPRSDDHSVSWPEIFSQHQSNLNRHLQICGMVKQHVVPESPSFRAISSMLNRTQELLKQLEELRSEFMPQHNATRFLSGKCVDRVDEQRAMNRGAESVGQGPATSLPSSQSGSNQHPSDGASATGTPVPLFVFDKTPTPISLPQRPRGRTKRSLDDESRAEDNGEAITALPKRKRQKFFSIENGDNTSASTSSRFVETEDISAEVEARLKAKEESRRRMAEDRERKRKRNSSGSNSGGLGAESSSQQPTKRFRAYHGTEREELSGPCPTDGNVTKREKRRAVGNVHEMVKINGERHGATMYKKLKKS